MRRTSTTQQNRSLSTESSTTRFTKWPTKFVLMALVGIGLLGLLGRTASVRSRAQNTVQAAGRGLPYFHLQDGREMQVAYRGDESFTAALRSGSAQPRSLAAIDLDRNGTPDVLAGYSYNGSGLLTLQRGNPDAFAPKSDDVFVRINQGYNPDSLLPAADVIQVPEAVDFLQVGDFNHDNQRDVLVAANGGGMFLLAGDGQGGLRAPEQIALAGSVTALAAGEFRAPDGWTDVAVGVNGTDGPQLLIFDGVDGLAGEPMRLRLSAAATAVEFGEMDSSPFMGVAVATGSQIEVVHGWGRKQSPALESRVETIDAGGDVRGLAAGFFIWNREVSKQLAALGADGTVRILQRGQANTLPFSEAELTARARLRLQQRKTTVDVEAVQGWQAAQAETWRTVREVVTGNVVGADATAQNLLLRAHVSFVSTDDLMVLGANQQRLDIVRQVDATAGSQANVKTTAGDMVLTRLDTAAAPATAMALPQKLNGERSLLLLQAGSAAPTEIPLAPTATIVVDRTDDVIAAACTGAASDCSLRGAVQFANAAPGTVITLATATYVLTTNGANGCVNEPLATGNNIGDLEVNASTTFNGNGAANTIIRQGAATNDRVLCMDVPLTSGLTFAFSGMTITGGRDVNSNVGGGGFIGGARNVTTNLTSVTFANNQTTGPNISGGGGVAVTGGSMTITSCTFGAANLPGANRNDLTLGNASNSNSAGGLSYSPGDPAGIGGATGTLTVTGTTFTHNTSSSGSAGGGGMDVFNFNTSTGTANISSSTFTSNQATGTASGGGLNNESLNNVNISTTSFTSNSAGNRGGGVYVGGGAVLLDGTSPSVTFTSNTATSGGSSVSTASAVNVSGTNTSIGGDIEVTTNGTWTNNAGSTLAPTNVVIVGGTFTCNNSTMNVGGNLTIQSGAVVGGAFNGNTGTVNIAGNFSYSTGPATPTFTAGTNTFNFNGSGAQSISNSVSITFNNLTDSNTTQPLTLNNSFAVNGTLNINGTNAILDPVAAAVISGAGTLTGTGTARVRRTAATADFLSQYTITTKTLTNLTVEYIGAAAQTVSALTYNNLKLNNASGATLAAGTTTVNGTLSLTNGALNVSSNTLVINNGSAVTSGTLTSGATGTVNYNQSSNGQSVLVGTYGNLTFSNFMKVLPSGTVGVAGTFTPGSGVGHTITGNTFDFNGTGAQTVPAFNYNNLTISGARGGATVTLASGTITVAGTFNPSATAVVYAITGNTFDFNGAGAQTVPAFNYNNLTISGNRGGGAVTLGAGNVGVAGTFNPAATNNTYVTTGNTVVFNGSALQTIPAFTFNGLTLNNAAGANLGGDVTVNGALTLTAGALGVGTNTLTLNGAVSATGGSLTSAATGTVNYNQGSNGQATVLAANYGNLTFSNFSKTLAGSGTIGIAGTFTPGSGTGHTITGSTINFNGAGTQTIPGFTYNNLTSSGGAVGRTLDPVNTIKIAGVFTPGTNVYTITGSTIEYNGSGSPQTLPSSGFNTYNNLTLNNTAGTTGFAGLTVNGLIRVQAGTFTSSSTYNNVQIDSGATLAATAASTINVSGSWTNGGTFTANTGTVNFNGSSTQVIGGTVGQTFNNLTNSNAAGLTMNFDNTVNGVLALTSSDITVAATKTLTQPVGGSSSGTFDVNGRVQRTGFTTGGAALSFGNPFNTIQVTAGTAPANIVVDLARSAPSGFSNAVLRTYTITPSAGGFTGTLRLHYLDSELNGNTEGANLILRRFSGTGWSPVTPTSFDTTANWVEKTGVTTFSPWTLSSCCVPTASNGVVNGRITDANGGPVAGTVVNLSGTQTRKTITDANGNYKFTNVDTNGFYTVTPARANFSFSPASRSFSQVGSQTEAAFTGASTGDAVNPLDTAEFFVRQQYVDILGREPDEAGFNYWSDQILTCAGDVNCTRAQRTGVAAAFFIENEFKQSGAFIYNVYKGALGRRPVYSEYAADRSQVIGGPTLDAQKQAFAAAFVARAEFASRYESNTTADSFVDALLANVQASGVDLTSQRDTLISRYNTGANQSESRALVLREVTESAALRDANYNAAFVLVEYFGYLQRNPDQDGYEFWLNVLNNGDAGNYRGMVCSFVTSTEYQHRFSGVVSHSNGECGQ